MSTSKGKSPIHQSFQLLKFKLSSDIDKPPIQNPFQSPLKNTKPHNKKKKSSSSPLTSSERLIFFLHDRQNLTREIVEKLPSEIYYKIVQTPSTAEINLLQKINQLYHTYPEGSYRVIKPNSSIIKLVLNPITTQSQKIWAIQNGLCYGLVSHSYHDRISLFPTLTNASSKLRDLCSDKLYFRFHSTPPIWEDEWYEPAQHIVFVTEYFGWWDSQPTQFLSTNGDKFYSEEYLPKINQEIFGTDLKIDRVFTQLQLQHIMEAFPAGFHIFHHSANWIFATNVQGILNWLLPKFTGNFIHEPHWPTIPWQ